ncbi:MAG: right-handed parallel beta-helix repeat-containing protein, partial [Armatimonadetes bacterium]|nr:right-handed parallel beta-helix repeat-containing protein [Armatimonadota bacterium]
AANENLNGNYGGGIFIQDCERIRVAEVTSRDNNGDGVSWQVCHDVTIEGCWLLNNSDLGLHPGSGSQRPVIRGNVSRGNDQGLFFCWGVKGGIAEGNTIEDSGKFGISIGHRDTDNVIRDNVIRRSGQHGVIFREHVHPARDPHRNVLQRNVIEDSGTKGECVAIEMLGTAEDVVLRDNVIRDTRRKSKARQRIGLRIGPGIRNLTQENCIYENVEVDVVVRRER